MDRWNNRMSAAGTMCRSVSLLITPPVHHPIIPLARLSSLLTVPSFYRSIVPIFPLEKYGLSRQWSSLFPALYFLFPFLADYPAPPPLPASSPSRVIVKNIPGLSRHELKRQIVYKEPRFRFFFNLYMRPAVNAYPPHQYRCPSAYESHSYAGFLSFPRLTFPSTRSLSELSIPASASASASASRYVSKFISGSVPGSGFASTAIVFKHLRHIRTIPGAVPALEFIRGEASPLRPRPPDGTRGPGGKPTPLPLIFPAFFFPTGIHSPGDMDTGPAPRTRSIYTGNRLNLREPAMFTHAGPGLPGDLPASAWWNRTRLQFTTDRPRQPRHPAQHHQYRQVFTFTHPAELFHKPQSLSLSLPEHGNREQKAAAAQPDVNAPPGSPGHSPMSTGKRIPVSPAGKVTGTVIPPPGPHPRRRVSSMHVTSFPAFFHYEHGYNTIREHTRLSTAGRRKIAGQSVDIKDTSPSRRLPLHYLNPWKIVSAAVGKPGAGLPSDAGSPADTGPGGRGYRARGGYRTRPYDNHDMVNEPGGSRMPGKTDIDLNQLTNRVYDMLERKIKNEKERRGW